MGMLLDLFRNKWPYTDFHELNADWIISTVRQLIETMDSFIQNESISFADPITWNISSQYAKATVVIDSVGNAYLSKQAVPAGIQLNNNEYWLLIFDFTTYTRTANRNLTFNVETDTTRATADYNVDDWLILNDVLYKVTRPIAIDDTFIVAPAAGSNIEHFTVEDFCKAWIASMQLMYDTFTGDITNTVNSYYNSTQAQINQIIAGATVDSEVINARVGYSGLEYTTLKERLDSEVKALRYYDNMKYFTIQALTAGGDPIPSTNRAIMPFLQKTNRYARIAVLDAAYQYRMVYYSEPILKAEYMVGQDAWRTDTVFHAEDATFSYYGNYFTLLVRKTDGTDFTDLEIKELPNKFVVIEQIKDVPVPDFQGGTIDLNDPQYISRFSIVGQNTANCTLLNGPDGFEGTFTLFNIPRIFVQSQERLWVLQIFMNNAMDIWYRYINVSSAINTTRPWQRFEMKSLSAFDGKTVAILSDSGSTMYNNNAVEIEIQPEDVGVQLSAYITYYDVQGGLVINDYAYTADDIGTEVTFTPTADDVGKVVGKANNYNPSGIRPWWHQLLDYVNYTPINVSWSGSSMTSHEENKLNRKTAYAWHPAQIRKCGVRTPGTMNRTAPDFIIIMRGGNDWSHTPYAVLTNNYYSGANWNYPNNDQVGTKYGFKEAIAKTIQELRTAYPDAKIILATTEPIHRVNVSHFPPNNGTNTDIDFNNAIREAADFFGCGLINFDKAGITFENFPQYAQDNPPVHPNNAGHKLLALKALASIRSQYQAE